VGASPGCRAADGAAAVTARVTSAPVELLPARQSGRWSGLTAAWQPTHCAAQLLLTDIHTGGFAFECKQHPCSADCPTRKAP